MFVPLATALLSLALDTCRATTEVEEVGTTELDESVPDAVTVEEAVEAPEKPESVAERLDDSKPECEAVAPGSYTSTARLGF